MFLVTCQTVPERRGAPSSPGDTAKERLWLLFWLKFHSQQLTRGKRRTPSPIHPSSQCIHPRHPPDCTRQSSFSSAEMTECFFWASRGSSLTHGWPGSQSGADMRPGRRSVTTSFLPGTHFSPLREASARRRSVANVIYSPRGCVVVNAALPAASLTIRADSTAHAAPGSGLVKVAFE